MPEWVKEGQLARSSRPGYPSHSVPLKEVESWITMSKQMGIRSIICLLSEEQLQFYSEVPSGLLSYYRKNGFTAEHIPITDPAHDPRGWDELNEKLVQAYKTFQALPKPLLVHCSAGVDRTGAVVKYIQGREKWCSEAEVSR